MSKLALVNEIKALIAGGKIELSDAAVRGLATVEKGTDNPLSDKASTILNFLASSPDHEFLGAEIAEANGIATNAISGTMQGLVKKGYVGKSDESPRRYWVTEDGVAASNQN